LEACIGIQETVHHQDDNSPVPPQQFSLTNYTMSADVIATIVFGTFMAILAIFALWKEHFDHRRGKSLSCP
jgi:hypothetical protein